MSLVKKCHGGAPAVTPRRRQHKNKQPLRNLKFFLELVLFRFSLRSNEIVPIGQEDIPNFFDGRKTLKHILEEPTLATQYLITSAQHSFRMKNGFRMEIQRYEWDHRVITSTKPSPMPNTSVWDQNYILKIIIILLVKTNRLWVFSIQLLKAHKKKTNPVYMDDANLILTYWLQVLCSPLSKTGLMFQMNAFYHGWGLNRQVRKAKSKVQHFFSGEKLRLNHPSNTPNWIRKVPVLSSIYPPP